jgi:hypothetical protein
MPSIEEMERLAREERSVKALEKIAQELEAIKNVLLNLHGDMKVLATRKKP